MPEMGSNPMVASIRPIPPETMPLRMSSPLRAATKVIPRSESMKNSGEPKERTSGATVGTATAIATALNTVPTRELMRTAPRARPAAPFLAMEWPSTIVDAVVGSPGTPNKTEVMSPVVAVTAVIPKRKANASTADILKIKGSIRAIAVGPPSPGKMPTTKPMAMPMHIKLKVDHVKHWTRPEPKAPIISSIAIRLLSGQPQNFNQISFYLIRRLVLQFEYSVKCEPSSCQKLSY